MSEKSGCHRSFLCTILCLGRTDTQINQMHVVMDVLGIIYITLRLGGLHLYLTIIKLHCSVHVAGRRRLLGEVLGSTRAVQQAIE